MLGEHKQIIEAIAKLYKNAMEMISLSTVPVPYIKAEDETAIIPDQSTSQTLTKCGDFVEEKARIISARKASLLMWEMTIVLTNGFSTHSKTVKWQLMPQSL